MASHKDSYGATAQKSYFLIDPEAVTIVTDPDHPGYDERITMPLVEETIESMMRLGVLEPILVRKDGVDANGRPVLEVEDGRRRTLHAREANRRLIKMGKPPIQIPFIVRMDDDATAFQVQIEANAHREDDLPMMRARKMQRALQVENLTLKQVASRFKCGEQTVKNQLELLRLHPNLQKLVDAGKLGNVVARRLATAVPRDQQEAELAKIIDTQDAAREGDLGAVNGAPKAKTNAEIKATLDKKLGTKGKVRARVMKGRAEMEAYRNSLLASKAADAPAAAATLAWVLGMEEPFADFPALAKRLAGLNLDVDAAE